MAKILVADDERGIRIALKKFLQSLGHEVYEAADGEQALKILTSKSIDLAFIDIKMPKINGFELLEREKTVPKVVLTAYGSMSYTVKAIEKGAVDYIVKPFELDDVRQIVEKLVEENTEEELDDFGEQLIIGSSKKMQEVFKMIARVAKIDATVLITGESGSGKELVARAIHMYSHRKNSQFVAVNCAALPPNLLEAELFGYEKGAFTGANSSKRGLFEEASGGTLFLDEIGELELSLQSKLLRAIQEKEIRRIGGTSPIKVDARIIAATNKDLRKAVEEGKFREDLFYRLNVLTIHVPPLRERKEDIIALANHFIKKFSVEFKLPKKRLSDDAKAALLSYDFPGNVRELENMILKAMLISPFDTISSEELFQSGVGKGKPDFEDVVREFVKCSLLSKSEGDLYDSLIGSAEKILIEEVLKACKWNQKRAAEVLGIHRNTLRMKIKSLNIELPKKRSREFSQD